MAIIEVNHVTKEFRLGQLQGLKQTMLDTVARLRNRAVAERAPFKALDDVEFEVEQGEVLGIIGHNGAGKSTLLKLLARISTPTRGSIRVNADVAPLIEVGAGLVPDLTGRENIYLNATILGLKRAEIREKFDEIVAFAELEEFIDTPVKRYSSGMQVRLGFSVATSVSAKILIIDEVLAVGDLAFQRKCFDRLEGAIKRDKKTVLLVSHNIRQVERICSRVILLDQGKIIADGKPIETCNYYYELTDEKIRRNLSRMPPGAGKAQYRTSGEIELLDINLIDDAGRRVTKVVQNSDVTVSIRLRANTHLEKPNFGVGVHTADFLYLATHQSEEQFYTASVGPGEFALRCKLRRFPFLPAVYSLRFGVAVGEMFSTAFYAENLLEFQVVPEKTERVDALRQGFVALDAQWRLTDAESPAGETSGPPEEPPKMKETY